MTPRPFMAKQIRVMIPATFQREEYTMVASRIMFLLLASVALAAASQTVPASEASKHIGEHATVCGSIAGEHTAENSRGTPTFINLDQPYPHQVFTILIWGEARNRVGAIPTSGRFCATGFITQYRGVPEIVLRNRHDWYVPK